MGDKSNQKVAYTWEPDIAVRVLGKILDSYYANSQVFRKKRIFLPDEKIPDSMPKGSKEHAIFLMDFVGLAPAVYSQILYDALEKVFEKNPFPFKGKTENEIREFLKKDLNFGFQNSQARRIFGRNQKVENEYAGDPRNIFAGREPRESIELLTQLPGYGIKSAALYTLYAHKYGFASFKQLEELLPAIDRHKIRIFYMTGASTFSAENSATNLREILSRELAFKLSDLCAANNLSIMHADEALWALGSELCVRYDYFECKDFCPIFSDCSREFYRERKGKLVPDKIPRKPRQRELF